MGPITEEEAAARPAGTHTHTHTHGQQRGQVSLGATGQRSHFKRPPAETGSAALTFPDHAGGHGVLGGVVGGAPALRLPGVLADGNQLFPLLDGHLGLQLLPRRLQRRRGHRDTDPSPRSLHTPESLYFITKHTTSHGSNAATAKQGKGGGASGHPYLTAVVNILTLLAEGDSGREGGREDRLLRVRRQSERREEEEEEKRKSKGEHAETKGGQEDKGTRGQGDKRTRVEDAEERRPETLNHSRLLQLLKKLWRQ